MIYCFHLHVTIKVQLFSPTQADLSVPLKEHTLFCHRHRKQYFIVLIDSSGKVRQQTEDLDDTKGMERGMEMFTVMGSSFLVWVAYFDSFICSEWWHSFRAILYPMLWFIFLINLFYRIILCLQKNWANRTWVQYTRLHPNSFL